MLVIADNDIILKLAKCDLLSSINQILDVDLADIFIAPACKFQLVHRIPAKAMLKCGGQETLDRVQAFLEIAKDIPAVEDLELLGKLAAIPKIDSGEQLLFSSCMAHGSAILLTGDRAALDALTAHALAVPEVVERLRSSVVTFESALLLAISIFGFEVVKVKLLAYPGAPDGVLKYVVCPAMLESDLIECLVSYSRSTVPYLAFGSKLPAALFAVPEAA